MWISPATNIQNSQIHRKSIDSRQEQGGEGRGGLLGYRVSFEGCQPCFCFWWGWMGKESWKTEGLREAIQKLGDLQPWATAEGRMLGAG